LPRAWSRIRYTNGSDSFGIALEMNDGTVVELPESYESAKKADEAIDDFKNAEKKDKTIDKKKKP
jgi:cell division septal protein FtsQ